MVMNAAEDFICERYINGSTFARRKYIMFTILAVEPRPLLLVVDNEPLNNIYGFIIKGYDPNAIGVLGRTSLSFRPDVSAVHFHGLAVKILLTKRRQLPEPKPRPCLELEHVGHNGRLLADEGKDLFQFHACKEFFAMFLDFLHGLLDLWDRRTVNGIHACHLAIHVADCPRLMKENPYLACIALGYCPCYFVKHGLYIPWMKVCHDRVRGKECVNLLDCRVVVPHGRSLHKPVLRRQKIAYERREKSA